MLNLIKTNAITFAYYKYRPMLVDYIWANANDSMLYLG